MKKITIEDVVKRLENLEKVLYEIEVKRLYPYQDWTKYPPTPQTYHYHNGIICYQNPCVWCNNNTH